MPRVCAGKLATDTAREAEAIADNAGNVSRINHPSGAGNTEVDVDREVAVWVASTGFKAASPRCSLFARKFPPVHLPSTSRSATPGAGKWL
eukprot:scaffold36936_cov15-Tisochrysis_lutea.AAC.1